MSDQKEYAGRALYPDEVDQVHENMGVSLPPPPKYACPKHGEQGSRAVDMTHVCGDGTSPPTMKRMGPYCWDCVDELLNQTCFLMKAKE